jgi:hypothetical protein
VELVLTLAPEVLSARALVFWRWSFGAGLWRWSLALVRPLVSALVSALVRPLVCAGPPGSGQ